MSPMITAARVVLVSVVALVGSVLMAGEVALSPIVYTGAPGSQIQPAAASDGTNFLVAWRDFRDPSDPAIYVARVDSDGRLMDQPTAIRIPDPAGTSPVVAWTGSVYLVAWEGAGRMRFVRIGADGQVLDPAPRNLGNIAASPAGAASGRNRAMIVYMGSSAAHPPSNVHAALFDVDGNVVKADIPIPPASAGIMPKIASNDQNFYVVWRSFDGVQTVVMGAMVSLDGIVGQGRVIAPAASGPMLASNGSDFLVASMDAQQRLRVEHIDRQGTPLSGAVLPYTISPPFTGTDNFIGRDGSGYILAAIDRQQHPVGVVLDGGGAQIGEVALASSNSALPSNGKVTLAAWAQTLVGGDIFARIVGVQSPETLVSAAAAQQTSARIAFGGSCYLAVWLEVRGPDGVELRAGRLSLDGTPLDGEGIQLADHIAAPPQVVFDGQNFVIAWTDGNAIVINQMTTGGILLDGLRGRVEVDGHRGTFALGSNGVESLLVWTETLNPFSFVPFIHAMRIDRDSTFFPSTFIPLPVNDAVELAVAGTRDEWLLSWSDARPLFFPPGLPLPPVLPVLPSSHDILAARLSSTLHLLDAVPLSIATEDLDHRDVAVAAGPADFVVAWDQADRSGQSVHARTVTSAGLMGESRSIAEGTMPSVVRIGDDYIIAWQDQSGLSYSRFAQRSSVLSLAISGDAESHVALATGLDQTLIAVYERLASESVYGDVSRSFAQLLTPTKSQPRKRAVMH